jgi:hypothetical protein
MIATPWPWSAAQHEVTGSTGGIQRIDTKRANAASIGAPMMRFPLGTMCRFSGALPA